MELSVSSVLQLGVFLPTEHTQDGIIPLMMIISMQVGQIRSKTAQNNRGKDGKGTPGPNTNSTHRILQNWKFF
jgi:hypothetical protein